MALGTIGRRQSSRGVRTGSGVLLLMAPWVFGACSSEDASGRGSSQEQVSETAEPLVDQPLGLLGNEPHIAIDPTNEMNIAVAQFASVSLSTDGGATFPTTVNVPAPPGFNYSLGGDPSLAYDSQGRLFLSFLATSNSGGIDVFIQEINHAAGMLVGASVNVSASAGFGTANGSSNDKEWLAIDRFPGSPFQDRLYMIWTDLAFADSLVRVSFSSDGGQNWSTAQTLDALGEGFTWPPHIAVAPNGDVYADYHADAQGEVFVIRSPFDSPTSSGGVFDLSTKVSVFPPGAANLTNNVQGTPPNLNGNQSWTLGSQQAYILPDPTNANNVMIISSDDPTDDDHGAGFDDSAVFAVTTTNRGMSWSAPVQVDAGPGTSHQLFPTGAFDLNTQCVSIMYYDSRAGATNANGNFLLDVFVRTSPDGGSTWFPEVQINDTPFDPDMLAPDRFPPTQTFRIGEYNGLLHARGAVWTGNNPADPAGMQRQRILFDYSDGVPPSFTSVPANVTTSMCGSFDIGTAAAQDNECGIGGVVVTNDAPASFPPGETIVTWTATDAAGNSVTATQRVTVVLGDNPACCPAGTNVIVGTSNNDTLVGTNGSDCILGLGGQDLVNGLGGADFIAGGHGNDVVNAGSGNDTVFAGSGQDVVNGDDGNDWLSGDDGDDSVSGGNGDDTLHGGQGQDALFGGDADDQLFGDDGDDNLQGGNGADDLVGGPNNDTCNGGPGTNTFAQCESGAPNSCTDGVQNGTEAGVDCGGACPGCPVGGPCVTGADCAGGLCQAGVCQAAPPGTLVSTSLSFTTDWGGGYCAVLNVTNASTSLATSYTISLDTNASTIYTSWNGAFSGASGAITVTPALTFNATLDPGETDSSIGFCANRSVPGSGTLPFVLSTSATF